MREMMRMNQVNMLRKEYPTYFESITNIINVLDPCGLVASGAPENEHEVLVGEVLFLIINHKENEIKELIINAYDWYDMSIHEDYTDENYPCINKAVIQIIEVASLYKQNNH